MTIKTEATTLQAIKSRAARGHATWVFWNDRSGDGFAARYSVDAVKAAMLATGTARKFFTVDAHGNASGHRWRAGCLILRNAAIGC